MGKKSFILLALGILIISSIVIAFDFPKTQVTILDQPRDSFIEIPSRMVPIEVKSLQELKSVKLKINDKKPRTICRDGCWDYRSVKPMPLGVNNIKIILENFDKEVEVYNFTILVTK